MGKSKRSNSGFTLIEMIMMLDNNSLVTNTPSSFKIKSELSSSGGPSGNGADAGAISFSVFH